jgi:hypothetical protein
MVCKGCKSPLHRIGGGEKSEEGTTKIVMVNIWGCMNPECELKMQEQDRTYTEKESFEG